MLSITIGIKSIVRNNYLWQTNKFKSNLWMSAIPQLWETVICISKPNWRKYLPSEHSMKSPAW